MRDLLSSFFFVNNKRFNVGRPLITHAEAGAASTGLPEIYRDTASPATHIQSRFGLPDTIRDVPIPGRWVFRIISVVLIVSALLSCSNQSRVPQGVLSKEEMTKILTEFYLKEARINTLHVNQDSTSKLMKYFRIQYARQTGIPDSIVNASYDYYMAHPIELSEIYDRIIDTLALREHQTPNAGPKSVE